MNKAARQEPDRREFLKGSAGSTIAAVALATGLGETLAAQSPPTIRQMVNELDRVADLVERAIARFDRIIANLDAGPSNDPRVQAMLQSIDTSCQTLINMVLVNPGPISDPAVQATIQGIANIGDQLSRDAKAKLAGGVTAPP